MKCHYCEEKITAKNYGKRLTDSDLFLCLPCKENFNHLNVHDEKSN